MLSPQERGGLTLEVLAISNSKLRHGSGPANAGSISDLNRHKWLAKLQMLAMVNALT